MVLDWDQEGASQLARAAEREKREELEECKEQGQQELRDEVGYDRGLGWSNAL